MTTGRRLAIVMFAAIGVFIAPMMAETQQRDSAPAIQGTSEISGVIVSDEPTPRPIRRAIVTISGDLPSARSAVTDDDGRFSFGHLPGGKFVVTAKKAAYLPAAYGAAKPGRPGSAISLAPGQRAVITVTMARGAAITGTLRDQSGAPVNGISVSVLDLRLASGADSSSGPLDQTTTDDRGVYRFFGLMPGEYVIAAAPTAAGTGLIGARSPREMDAVLAALAQRQGNGTTIPIASASAPLPVPGPASVGFASVYYPGTPLVAEAARVRVAAGEERGGIDFLIQPVPVATITGTITGDVPNLAAVQLSIVFSGPRPASISGTNGIFGTPPDAEGKFTFSNVAPGPIRIVARGRRGGPDDAKVPPIINGMMMTSGGARGNEPLATSPGETLFGVVDLELRGQDLTGLNIALQPGGVLAGRLIFDSGGAPAPADLTKIAMSVSQPGGSYMSSSGGVTIGNSIGSVSAAAVRADGSFEIKDIGPTTYVLNCQLPQDLAAIWKMRSAIIDGRDLLDTLVDGKPGVTTKDVAVTLSDKRTSLAGVLQTAAGQPAAEYYVIAFPTDRALWRVGSRRMQSTRPATDGRFAFNDLPAGEYFIAALTDLDPADWQSASQLEQSAAASIKVTLAEGEQKTQNLTLAGRQ